MPSAGTSPIRIRDGAGFAPDPDEKFLSIQLNGTDGARLIRVPFSAGPEAIRATPYRVVRLPLQSNEIGPAGKIVVQVAPRDSWY